MAAGSSKDTSVEELLELLVEDIDKSIVIVVESFTEESRNKSNKHSVPFSFCSSSVIQPKGSYQFLYNCDEEFITWGKSLLNLPVFTIKEIEKHRLKSGKTPDSAISKSKEKGLKFKGERYISADTIYSLSDDKYFCFKAVCIPSMKKGKRNIFVALDLTNGEVIHADCSCPAGKCGYCNHVMALLLEVADYSLHNLPEIPTEVSCTSRLRQWGVPGKSKSQAPVRQTTIQKSVDKKGISSTLYNPKKTVAVIEEEHISRMSRW